MNIIIEGAGQVGAHLAKMLSNESNEITVIDPDPERIRFLSQTADVATILGGPSSIPDLKEAGATSADLFIAVNPLQPQSVNIVSALLAKKLGTRRVVARVDDEDFLSPENKLLFKDMGLDMMFFPEKSASDEVDDMLRSTASTDTLDFARGKLQLGVCWYLNGVVAIKVGNHTGCGTHNLHGGAHDGLTRSVLHITFYCCRLRRKCHGEEQEQNSKLCPQ